LSSLRRSAATPQSFSIARLDRRDLGRFHRDCPQLPSDFAARGIRSSEARMSYRFLWVLPFVLLVGCGVTEPEAEDAETPPVVVCEAGPSMTGRWRAVLSATASFDLQLTEESCVVGGTGVMYVGMLPAWPTFGVAGVRERSAVRFTATAVEGDHWMEFSGNFSGDSVVVGQMDGSDATLRRRP
jgi:hypothetical protein